MKRFQERYGGSIAHLVAMLCCFLVAAYALSRIWRQGGLLRIVAFFLALLILHDAVGWPAYTWADRLLQRASSRQRRQQQRPLPWTNHVRVPSFISGVLLIIALPLILRVSAGKYAAYSGLSESPYLFHWLLVTFVLFGASALVYVFRLSLARWRGGR